MASPADYADLYLDLKVPSPIDGQPDLASGISVGKYVLGVQAESARSQLLRKVEKDFAVGKKADKAYSLAIRVVSKGRYETKSFDTYSFALDDPLYRLLRYPFGGKGSPEAVQAVLQVAASSGPGGAGPLVEPAGFQKYCDDNLGTDCSGFVGNYLRHEVLGGEWWEVEGKRALGPQETIDGLLGKAPGVFRLTTGEIAYTEMNLLAEVDSTTGRVIPGGSAPWGHTGVSVPGMVHRMTYGPWFMGWHDCPTCPDGTGLMGIEVVESTGGLGLARSWYHVFEHPLSAKSPRWKGVFRMHRGVKNEMRDFRLKAVVAPPAK